MGSVTDDYENLDDETLRRIAERYPNLAARQRAEWVLLTRKRRGERAVEALTLDCPPARLAVPAQRILEAVEAAIERHEIAFLGGPLRGVLRINPMVGDDGTDTIFGDLSRAITAAVVKVLGGAP